MIYYVSIRAHVLDDKSSETDVFCDFGLSTIKKGCVLISLTSACTVAALAFSPIHNITTKSLYLAQPGEVQGGLLSRLFIKIKSLLGKKKKTEAAEEEKETVNNETDKEE